MHVTILTIGSRGDVQPCVALGKGLRQAGHRVTVATHTNFEDFVGEQGLDFLAAIEDIQLVLGTAAGQQLFETGENGLRALHDLAQTMAPYAQQTLSNFWDACQETDAILFNTLALPAYHIAEKRQIPACAAWIYPLTRTQAFPCFVFPPWLRLGPHYNRFTYFAAEQTLGLIFRRLVNAWREDVLDLPPLPFSGLMKHFYQQEIPVLYGYSPQVIPPPPDWPDRFTVTGYWFLERPDGWQPPPALVDFIQAGPPPVYVGFGSMNHRPSAGRLIELVVEALRRAGQRGILSRGWSEVDIGSGPLSDDLFVIEDVPHDWLFPQMAAVVHHGGSGTTSAGLRAGVPTIITPFFIDQPLWGQRVAELGVGPAPILHKKLTAERLAAAIRSATTDESMAARAASLARKIQAEAGVAQAVATFNQWVAQWSRPRPGKPGKPRRGSLSGDRQYRLRPAP